MLIERLEQDVTTRERRRELRRGKLPPEAHGPIAHPLARPLAHGAAAERATADEAAASAPHDRLLAVSPAAACVGAATPARGAAQGAADDACCSTRMLMSAHVLLLLGHLAATCAAIWAPLVRRRLEGNLPALLDELGFDFTASYSMWDLGLLAVGTGGWDLLMAATFQIFVLIVPVLRPASLLVLLLAPLQRRTARRVFLLSRYLSFYYAHEVMLVVVPLLQATMGPLTAGILMPANFPPCVPLQAKYGQLHCFAYAVDMVEGYYFTFVAVGMHILAGFDGSPTHKFLHRRLFPEEPPPPPHCCERRGARRAPMGPINCG